MDNKKKRFAVISSIIAVMFIAPLIVFAAIYKSNTRNNRFEPASAEIQIEENSISAVTQEQTYTFPATTDSSGNYSVDKEPLVGESENPNGEYMRVRFVPMWYDKDGYVCAGIEELTNFSRIELNDDETALLFCKGSNASDVIITLHLTEHWNNHWEYVGDGCFESKNQVRSANAKNRS